jgi:hypothetical protein
MLFGGGSGQSTIEYWPRQNGEFRLRVVRLDGNVESILIERRVVTDKALLISMPSLAATSLTVSSDGIRTSPEVPRSVNP